MSILYIILAIIPIIAILFFGLAIHFYPGGNYFDHNAEKFSFLYNTMSDLGKVNAVNGEWNIISRIFYSIALTLISIFVLVYYGTIWRYFQEKMATKIISLIGTIIGIIQSIIYFALAYTPDDTLHLVHVRLIYGAGAFLFAAILFYDIAYFLKRDFPKLNTYSYLIMIFIAIFLTIAIAVTPRWGSPISEMPRRAGHTLFIFIVSFIYSLQSIGAVIYTKRQIKQISVNE